MHLKFSPIGGLIFYFKFLIFDFNYQFMNCLLVGKK